MIKLTTAGESHGPVLTLILEGIPADLKITKKEIDSELKRRQLGFGRSARMSLESDSAELLSGIRFGKTLGSPVSMTIENRIRGDWLEIMSIEKLYHVPKVVIPRPGHADLPGMLKYNTRDLRNILERSSARETAARVAGGAVIKKLLSEIGIEIHSHVTRIGSVQCDKKATDSALKKVDSSPVRCIDPDVSSKMMAEIDAAQKAGDSVGGIFEVVITGCAPGFGSHVSAETRLDGLFAQAVMGIPAIKAVEIGAGYASGSSFGSQVHDEIFYSAQKGYYRKTNNAGGIEGGMTNGEDIIVRGVMKPIPTLAKPLRTVNIDTKKAEKAHKERTDVCAVPSAAVIAESMCAIVVANAILQKLGGDHMGELKGRYKDHLKFIKKF